MILCKGDLTERTLSQVKMREANVYRVLSIIKIYEKNYLIKPQSYAIYFIYILLLLFSTTCFGNHVPIIRSFFIHLHNVTQLQC
jgi:hypothetical protein